MNHNSVVSLLVMLVALAAGCTTRLPTPGKEPTIPVEVRRLVSPQWLGGALVYSRNGDRLATEGGQACLWDVPTGKVVLRVGSNAIGYGEGQLALTSDGKWLLAAHGGLVRNSLFNATMPNPIRLWDVDADEEISHFKGDVPPAHTIALSPDGGKVLSTHPRQVNRDVGVYTCRLWDIVTGRELKVSDPIAGIQPLAVFGPDGRRAFVVHPDGNVIQWDLESGKSSAWFRMGALPYINRYGFSADGSRAWAHSGAWTQPLVNPDHQIQIWDTANGREVRRLVFPHPRDARGNPDPAYSVGVVGFAISHDGRHAAVVVVHSETRPEGSRELTVRPKPEFRLVAGQGPIPGTRPPPPPPSPKTITTSNRTIRICEVDSGRELVRFPVDSQILGMTFSPNGRHIAWGHEDRTVRIWGVFK